ncbi:MAG: DUF1804 family protein [Magnetococcales bacterium]|nr:DUF1804 family protein [Magnetococcales bacterium]
MAKDALKPEVRNRYILQGMSPDEIAAALPVSAATVRRWQTQAKNAGDDWDKARAAAFLSHGGADKVNQAMLQLLAAAILRAQEVLAKAESSNDPSATIELIGVIRGLSDAHIKTINATQRGSPEINRVALIQDFLLILEAHILRESADDIAVFRRLLPDFSKELLRVYGTAILHNGKIKELLARTTLDLGMAQALLQRQITFVRQHYPHHLNVILEILEPFGRELSKDDAQNHP